MTLLYHLQCCEQFLERRGGRKCRRIETWVGPVHHPAINRIKAQYICTTREVVGCVNNAFKTFDGDDGEAVRPE